MARGITLALLLTSGVTVAQDPRLARLPDDEAGRIVRRSIERAGGMDAWRGVRTLSFEKTLIDYDEQGRETRRRVQRHRYVLRPRLRVRIEWEEDGREIALVNRRFHAWKLVDGVVQTAQADVNQARNATFGSHYVFNMPFKLTDPGARLEHAGRRRLRDGTEAEAVRVTYDPGAGDAGGFHTWTYFFDSESARLAANLLEFGAGRYEYTEYLDDRRLGPLLLSTRRLGYEANAEGPVGRSNSEIVYERIRLNEPLPEELFRDPTGG